MSGDPGHAVGAERRRPGSGARGHRHGNRIADAGQVVLRDPRAQLHDARRQEGLAIDHFDEVLDRVWRRSLRVMGDDATGQRARSDRNAHARANGRQLEVVGNAVREAIEKGNWDRDGNLTHYSCVSIARTRFMSSQTSRLDEGFRSR